jgi:hypothetical protein
VQVTQAVAARYIVLWRVIRVVDLCALVIDFLLLLGAAAGWTLQRAPCADYSNAARYILLSPFCASEQNRLPW